MATCTECGNWAFDLDRDDLCWRCDMADRARPSLHAAPLWEHVALWSALLVGVGLIAAVFWLAGPWLT